MNRGFRRRTVVITVVAACLLGVGATSASAGGAPPQHRGAPIETFINTNDDALGVADARVGSRG